MSPKSKEIAVKHLPQIAVTRGILQANARLRDYHKAVFATANLGMSDFDMIATLGNTPGMRMSDLAKNLITSPSNVTRLCVSLEKRGLLERRRSAESDREVIASLTTEGAALFQNFFPLVAGFSCALVDSALTKAEQTQLADLLHKFFTNTVEPNLDDVTPAVVPK